MPEAADTPDAVGITGAPGWPASPSPLPVSPSLTGDAGMLARGVDEMSVSVLVYCGPEHIVVGANRAARAALCDRPEVLGRPLREVMPEAVGQDILSTMDRVYATGEPFTATGARIVAAGPDGASSREVYLDWRVAPVRDEAGSVAGLVGECVDVTDRVRRERSLDAERARLSVRYQDVREAVLSLQSSLLPAGLPVLSGVRLAAQYLVADGEQAAGGDWFDAIPLLDGRLALVVGDVVGHGAEASAVMGQLRVLLEEFLADGDDLVAALARLDRVAARVPGARGSTVCIAVLDPADGSLRYACAGHPPPLVVSGDGRTRTRHLPSPGGGPLGVSGPPPGVGDDRLRPGELLLCFTDGLVERPGIDVAVCLAELAEVASDTAAQVAPSLRDADPTDRMAELTVERMVRDGHTDDVTLLVARLTGRRAADLSVEVPAVAGRLATLRHELNAWLTDLGAGDDDVVAVNLAVLEAVTNSMEHAYPDPGLVGTVRVEGTVDRRGRACLTVTDHGTWRSAQPEPGHRGRGLTMIRECVDSVEVERGDGGTVVLMDRQLSHPAHLQLGVPSPYRMRPDRRLSASVERSSDPVLRVAGPLDLATAAEMRHQLWSASRGGALPLVLDLSAVTHLGSAGIQLLFEFAEQTTAEGHRPTLVVPPACPSDLPVRITGLHQVATVVPAR